jgi:hypothetical protein
MSLTFESSEIKEFLRFQREYSSMTFDSSYRRIESLTNSLPLVPREQYRLFCAFALFKIAMSKPKGKPTKIPVQILHFDQRLLSDVRDLPSAIIADRWNQFRTPEFISALETIAQGNTDLTMVINYLNSDPNGKSYLNFLNENRGKATLDLDPKFLHFLPTSSPSGLISDREYEQVRLTPRK